MLELLNQVYVQFMNEAIRWFVIKHRNISNQGIQRYLICTGGNIWSFGK